MYQAISENHLDMQTLKTLVDKVPLDDFRKSLDTEVNVDGPLREPFCRVFMNLKTMEVDLYDDEKNNPPVISIENDCITGYSGGCRRSAWLGVLVDKDTQANFSDARICVESVYEMTAFAGFTEDEETEEYKAERELHWENTKKIFACYFCDECKQAIDSGSRNTCTTCKSYDVCDTCFASKDNTEHDKTHQYQSVPWSVLPLELLNSDSSESNGEEETPTKLQS